MNKLEQAARQALEALQKAEMVYAVRDVHPMAVKQVEEAITALREALANTRSSIRSTSEYSEQVEQEQVAVLDITYGREPECYATPNAEDLPEGTYRLYAAPVRTKDLTDDEIDEIESEILMGGGEYIDVIRAVIAKFKEKNRV